MNRKSKPIHLDDDEKAIEESFDSLKSYPPEVKAKKIKLHQQAAKDYLTKNKRITIRVYSSDLERIKYLAAQEGLPYQTYITSILHKLSTGRLNDNR